jgi:hypothetical protein
MLFSFKATFRKLALLSSSGKEDVKGWRPSSLFYLKTEAEPFSGTLFLKKNIGRWIKSKSKILRNASHHRQNPSE